MSEGGKSATRLGILAPVVMASPKSTPDAHGLPQASFLHHRKVSVSDCGRTDETPPREGKTCLVVVWQDSCVR